MKKWLALLLVLALTVSLTGAAFAVGDEETAEGLPTVGDTVEGFTVREVRDFPLVGATVVVFDHDRTGAELIYIANSDTNRVFDLTFFTRAIDNTGLPHVFEHSTLDGSEKYPSKALFFNLSYQTYNTFMNAMTYPLMTTYPVASLSEEQLLKYADYYTDSCLHPTILEDESIFREEAWRYRMADAEDDLTIEGTVYSEMLGALDLVLDGHVQRPTFAECTGETQQQFKRFRIQRVGKALSSVRILGGVKTRTPSLSGFSIMSSVERRNVCSLNREQSEIKEAQCHFQSTLDGNHVSGI